MSIKRLMDQYNDFNYHTQARNRALKVKWRRLRRIQDMMGCDVDAVLEVGCGVGVYSNVFDDWVGVDISETALALNKGKNVVQASALRYSISDTCQQGLFVYQTVDVETSIARRGYER